MQKVSESHHTGTEWWLTVVKCSSFLNGALARPRIERGHHEEVDWGEDTGNDKVDATVFSAVMMR